MMSENSEQEMEIEDEDSDDAYPGSFMSLDKAQDGFRKDALDRRTHITEDGSYKKE